MKIYGIHHRRFFNDRPWYMPRMLWRVVVNRANPRSEDYMKALFAEKFPDGIYLGDSFPEAAVPEDRIVLLYADANGMGYGGIELKCFFGHQVETINGRRRHVHLTYGHWALLMVKRFLEKSILPELIVTPFVFITAAVLWAGDALRGRA